MGGDFKVMSAPKEMQQLEIESVDSIFETANGLLTALYDLNQRVLAMGKDIRDKMGNEENEVTLVFKDWIAKKTKDMKDLVAQGPQGLVDFNWKKLVPKVDVSALLDGDLIIGFPDLESVAELSSEVTQFVNGIREFAEQLIEMVKSNIPELAMAVGSIVGEAMQVDPSAMGEEVMASVGSNPFAVMKKLAALKGNLSTTLQLKGILEVVVHNIKILVYGLKDGIYKGLSAKPVFSQKSITAAEAAGAANNIGAAKEAEETQEAEP